MTAPDDRRDELVAAAATGALDDAERAELEQLAASDPTILEEVEALRALADRVDGLGAWQEPEPSDQLAARVAAIPATQERRSPRASRWGLAAAAVLLVAVGSVSTVAVQSWQDGPPSGPPGTLGAVEPVTVATDEGELPDVQVSASLVAHTWGTEAVLAVDGAPVGESFTVWFVDEDGEAVSAGAFLGSTVEIHCRLNAAVMREDVRQLRIADASGDVVAQADLPAVTL